jgi:hypothetical protein
MEPRREGTLSLIPLLLLIYTSEGRLNTAKNMLDQKLQNWTAKIFISSLDVPFKELQQSINKDIEIAPGIFLVVRSGGI